MTQTAPVELYSPEFFADPYAYYGWLRENDPVHWHAEHRMWILTRYEDVNRVARSPEVYSSRLAALDTLPPTPAVRPEHLALQREVDEVHLVEFIQLDPPAHTGKRAAVSARFAPKSLEPLRAMIAEVIAGLLDAVADQGGMDVLADLAKPLPLLVISRLMGVHPDDVHQLAEQATKRMANVLSLADDRLEISLEGFRETSEHLTADLDARRGCPVRDDGLGDMGKAEENGTYSRAESLANAMMIIDAGHETTIQLLCNSTLLLLQRPDQWARFVADPDGLAATAIDECLRVDPPLHVLRRVVLADVQLGEHLLRAGDRVVACVASANRDPRRFPDPETFDLERRPNTHLSFGAGAHYCLGQYLAKLEGQEFLKALARRFPTARVPAPDLVTYNPVPRVRSVTGLPISWS